MVGKMKPQLIRIQIMSKFYFLIFLLFALIVLFSCDNDQKNRTDALRKSRKEQKELFNQRANQHNARLDRELVQKMVEGENNKCPQVMGGGMMITEVSLEDSAMAIYCDCQNPNMIKALNNGLKDDIRQSILLSICQNNDDVKKMKLLKKTHTGIAYFFITPDKKKKHLIYLSPEELPVVIPSRQTVDSLTRVMFLNNLNADLPETIGHGMIQQRAILNGNDIIIMIECDESLIDMDKLSNMNQQNKQAMLEAMHTDEQGRAFFNAVRGLNCNIIYSYYGNSSNKKTDIIFLKNELN